jgi:hypothetical protein
VTLPILETPAAGDNRRATVRIIAYEVLRGISALARLNGGDTLSLLVFTGIWSANTQHLISARDRYAALQDVPSDSQRRPVPQDELANFLCIPKEIVAAYVAALIDAELVERTADGLVVPAVVFTRPEMLDGTTELHARVMSMVMALRGAGFRFDEID